MNTLLMKSGQAVESEKDWGAFVNQEARVPETVISCAD